MRSHLTRHVFRRILSNEPYVFHHSPARSATFSRHPHHASPHGSIVARRSIFGLTSQPTRYLKEADVDPGLDKMGELATMIKIRARPPPPEELVAAFNAFFKARQRKTEPLQEVQAHQAALTFEHLQENNAAQEGFGFSLDDLYLALNGLTKMAPVSPEIFYDFATVLFEETKQRRVKDPAVDNEVGWKNLVPYVKVLCQTGKSLEARRLVEKYGQGNASTPYRKLWARIMTGLAEEKNEEELIRTLDILKENWIPYDPKIHQVMTSYFALRDNVEETKRWYEHAIEEGGAPTYHTNTQILKFCIRNEQLDWGENVFKSRVESNPTKRDWDVIFQWAAAWGKGVDEIERMMGVMARTNQDNEATRPDIDTINGLVEFANSKNDAYAAERYVALGEKMKLFPNAKTYMLQIDYRLNAGDLDGARAAYNKLQGEESSKDEDLPVVNKLLYALCTSKRPPDELISLVVSDLDQRKARIEPRTVSALCLYHLNNGDLIDAHDLLQTHIHHYSQPDRDGIIADLTAFILDRSNKVPRVWDTYTLLREAFDETPISIRSTLMTEFFARRRPDMGCHVFGHMRQHIRPEIRPTVDTYIACFEGIGISGDLEGLEMVHNMMKLDMNLEPSTRLYNALMIAYTGADMAWRSLEFWDDIANSREGPTYESIVIALQACRVKRPFGEREASAIWRRLNDLGVHVTREVAASYLAVLGANQQWKMAQETMDNLEADTGLTLDALILGEFFNAMPSYEQQDDVEEWVQEEYPEAWAELEKIGHRTDKRLKKLYPVEVKVKP
ncbi:MAG: hypothetical protein M1833_005764 [Piccolia ochrophora]|nr:MAG: hypothetical protein M1833_005764 [Piccolia ochrophora]